MAPPVLSRVLQRLIQTSDVRGRRGAPIGAEGGKPSVRSDDGAEPAFVGIPVPIHGGLTVGEREGDGGRGRELTEQIIKTANVKALLEAHDGLLMAARDKNQRAPTAPKAPLASQATCSGRRPSCCESPLNADEIEADLSGTEHAGVAVGARQGFHIGAERRRLRSDPTNMASAQRNPRFTDELVRREVEEGWAEVYETEAQATAAAQRHCSGDHKGLGNPITWGRLGIVSKVAEGADPATAPAKHRLIHGSRDVNDATPEEKGRVRLDRVRQMERRARALRRKYLRRGRRQRDIRIVAAQWDWRSAFRALAVHPCSWVFNGFRFVSSDGEKRYGFWTRASFGLRSSVYNMCAVSDAVRYMMRSVFGISFGIYIDDSLALGVLLHDGGGRWSETGVDSCDRISFASFVFRRTCMRWGLPIKESKTVRGDCVKFLGVVLDFRRWEMRMTQTRLERVRAELRSWRSTRTTTRRELERMLGLLNWAAVNVATPGRIFLRPMYAEATRWGSSAGARSQQRRLSSRFRRAVVWWCDFLKSWHGRRMMDSTEWVAGAEHDFFTDASSSGYGAYYDGEFFAGVWPTQWRDVDIAIKEWAVMAVAVALWAGKLRRRRLIAGVDSQNVRDVMRRGGSTKSAERQWCAAQSWHLQQAVGVEFATRWIGSKSNLLSDALSRQDLRTFHNAIRDSTLHSQPVERRLPRGVFEEMADELWPER